MRLINVHAFLERERSAEERQWRANLQPEVLEGSYNWQKEYAILSHRWGAKEVDYIEIVDLMKMKKGDRDEIRARDGYQKILNSCKQAKTDRIEWLWVDTCCIDKRSSSELSEAINSMYRWYERSKICYAYFHDFEGWSFPTKQNNFLGSNGWPEWFSRGWTLQELIAPRKIQFFNKQWKSIGTKRTHADDLNKITRVPVDILMDGLTSNRPCVAQIMSWAANRQTARIEDQAYSLLGLLDVNMPMLYGEGKEAFQRLQLEIIRKSNDQSIFAWVPDRKIRWNGGGVLADDPSFFGDCHDIEKMEHDEYMIHLQERLPDGSPRPISLTDERLGTCSVTNRGIQIWLLITPHDNCPTVFFRASLACCRWDRRPMTIDLALWGPNYYRYPSTTRMPKSTPLFEKLYLSYHSQVYPDSTFKLGDYCGIHRTLADRGFTYRGSIPRTVSLDTTESLVLSGVNELLVAVYDEGQSGKTRFAVVVGYCFGHEWVHVTLGDCAEETWQEYADRVYNQMRKEGRGPMVISTHGHTHTHIVSENWSDWAVELTRGGSPERSSESTSHWSNIKLFFCGRTNCHEPSRGSVKGNSNKIRMLAKMTKFTPDLNGFVDRDATEVRKVVAKAYRGTLSSDGKPVQIKPDWPPKDDVKDAFHEQYIWSLLCHENIHPFLGILTTFDETVSTVAEWVDKGDAHSYVQNPNVDPSFLLLGLARALHYLHNHSSGPIVHGDVRGNNMLVADDGRTLLTNFSCSTTFSIDRAPISVGAIRWRAPEHIDDSRRVSMEGDVWAFGMTALELFSAERPFKDASKSSIASRIRQGPLPERPTRMDDEWWALCNSCWELEPASRPAMSVLVEKIEGIIAQSSRSRVVETLDENADMVVNESNV